MTLKLSPGGRTALWIGGGGLVGLAVGALLTNPRRAIELAPFWSAVTLLFVAVVLVFARAKPGSAAAGSGAPESPARKSVKVQATAPPSRSAPVGHGAGVIAPLHVFIEFPDVPDAFPPVLGHAEGARIQVRVERGGRPAEGAAVRLEVALDGRRIIGSDGVTGTDGILAFDVEPEHVGELSIRAQASLSEARGAAEASASIVRYEEEIQRLFGEFRAFAVETLGPEAETFTARELAERMRPSGGAEVARAVLELARVYELVAYGEREADRRAYLAVMEQLLVLERSDLPAEPKSAPARGA